mmetsp:Transcript_22766/g.32538  ORF Transcript_22766/g.32538 Transcript_22766/m.32538 type:complete len:229 (+) Transcript_22766:5248-5934(+)
MSSSAPASATASTGGERRRTQPRFNPLARALAVRGNVSPSDASGVADPPPPGGAFDTPVNTGSGSGSVGGLAGECVFVFLDDVLVISSVCVPGGLPPLFGRRWVSRRGSSASWRSLPDSGRLIYDGRMVDGRGSLSPGVSLPLRVALDVDPGRVGGNIGSSYLIGEMRGIGNPSSGGEHGPTVLGEMCHWVAGWSLSPRAWLEVREVEDGEEEEDLDGGGVEGLAYGG